MATVKVKFRTSSLSDREGRIYYQIIHERKTRTLPIGYPLFPSEWDETKSFVIQRFTNSLLDTSFFNEIEKVVVRLVQNGQIRTSQTYASTLRSFRRYRCDKDLPLESVRSEIMEGYQAWLHKQGVSQNTISQLFPKFLGGMREFR